LLSPNKKNQPIRVLIHGLAYFSQKLPNFLASEGWEFRNYAPRWSLDLPATLYQLHRCDLAYAWGGRVSMGKFLLAARALNKQKLVMFWCGSDVLEARQEFRQGRSGSWIAEKIHWAGAPWLAEEVRALGLHCEYVPTTWVQTVSKLDDLPKRFSVLAYLPDVERINLYGIDQVLEVARELPRIDFTIVGLQPGQTLAAPDNVTLHGRVADLEPFYRNATVIWRPTRHDGLSFMALEALAHGRYVIWSYPFSAAVHAREAGVARMEIERLWELHQMHQLDVNRAGADFIEQNFAPAKIRADILRRWKHIVESALPMEGLEPSSRAREVVPQGSAPKGSCGEPIGTLLP
jgi:glycosyltransferase involved in cell wall biosynthesis